MTIAGLGACGSLDGPGSSEACTEIGCTSGIIVFVRGSAGAEFEIALTDSRGGTRTETCVVQREECFVNFGFTPDDITLRVVGPGGAVTSTLTPRYEVRQPNGPGCPPVCQIATIRVRGGVVSQGAGRS